MSNPVSSFPVQTNYNETIEQVSEKLDNKCKESLEKVNSLTTEASAISMQKFDQLIVELKTIRFEFVDFMNRLLRTEPKNEHILSKTKSVKVTINILEKSIFNLEDCRRYYQIKLFNDSSMAQVLYNLFGGNVVQSQKIDYP